MKKVLILASIIISSSAMAQNFYPVNWFTVNAQCSLNRAQAKCSVYNRWYRPIICNVNANGTTQRGYRLNVGGQIRVLPGQYASVYVNANNPYIDPLFNAQAFASCRFL